MMRIGYFGDGRWARLSFERIADSQELEAAYLVARHDDPDPVLREYAQDLGIPFFSPPDVNEPSFLKELTEYAPDVNVSMSYDQILGANAIELAPEGFINCHAGALPFYRGRNVLNWVLINGEDRFGVTVHYVDESIDTGDIITQRFEVITPEDDYQSLLDKAVKLCADALLDALNDIQQGMVSTRSQEEIHPVGFYCSGRREGDEWIDWSWSTDRIYDFIRAIAPPGPGARTILDGRPLVMLASEKISKAPEYIDRPGTVVGRNEDGIVVKTGDSTLRITEIADWNGEIDNPRTPEYGTGTAFGMNLQHEVQRLSSRIDQLEQRIDHLEE